VSPAHAHALKAVRHKALKAVSHKQAGPNSQAGGRVGKLVTSLSEHCTDVQKRFSLTPSSSRAEDGHASRPSPGRHHRQQARASPNVKSQNMAAPSIALALHCPSNGGLVGIIALAV